MTIARATHADLRALLEVDVLLTTRVRQNEILGDSVRSGGCFVARRDAMLTGFITWDRAFFQRPFVRLLVVVASARRHGTGVALLERVELDAAPHGELFVSTESINAPMQALLLRLAYIRSGSIDNINAPGNPELIYHKHLPNRPA
ncbi:MAG: GNAT family N-acetyltransferase [Candidatus Eremiobacteraeota bacterium]|nr:GNAT family N-acetyltransferase [Candidatus Eremiobacteraeota bacterium]